MKTFFITLGPGFRTEFGSETTGCEFHIVDIWLIRLKRGLILLVNYNHVDNNLKEILVHVIKQSTQNG